MEYVEIQHTDGAVTLRRSCIESLDIVRRKSPNGLPEDSVRVVCTSGAIYSVFPRAEAVDDLFRKLRDVVFPKPSSEPVLAPRWT